MDQTSIDNKNFHLLFNNDNLREFYWKGTIFVVNKKEKNLQQLLKRNDPCNMKDGKKLTRKELAAAT